MNHYCLGFAFYPGSDSVALIHKLKPDWQAGKLNGIGGRLEDGELPKTAMSREFEEEAGVRIPPTEWVLFLIMKFSNAVIFCYAAESYSVGAVYSRTPETVQLVPRTRFMEMGTPAIPNLAWLIPMAFSSLRNPGPVPTVNYE